MRFVDRSTVKDPQSLMGARMAGRRELIRARLHFARIPPPKKAFTFRAYKGEDVRHALQALFHGKCAYCESRYDIGAPVDVEHFRPKGEVADTPGHSGYWWLAAYWANLLPSCIDCNRRRYQPTPEALASLSAVLDAQRHRGFRSILTGKDSCFPITGARVAAEPPASDLKALLEAEQPLLLNPCIDTPDAHLRFHIDRAQPLGIAFAASAAGSAYDALPALSDDAANIERAARAAGVSPRGAVSIQIYGLNRLGLVQERTRILRRLEVLGAIIVEVSAAADALETLTLADPGEEPVRAKAIARLRAVAERTLAEIKAMARPEAPFSTMVAQWIAQFRQDVASGAAP